MGANDQGRRPQRRSFRPGLEGRLESRQLLSTIKATVIAPRAGRAQASEVRALAPKSAMMVQPAYVHTPSVLVMRGGKGARIKDGNGNAFNVLLEAGPGTVTAKPLRDGRFDITVFGTNAGSELVITPLRPIPTKESAHTFQADFGVSSEILEVANIKIRSGKIGAILGYRTTNLSGTIDIRNDAPIDRIALNRLLPGALIRTTGDLDTLNIFTDATLDGPGTGIEVGRDLNWMLIDGTLSITGGATLTTGRDIGLQEQPEKDSDPGGQGAQVNGNVEIGPGSAIVIGRDLDAPFIINGNLVGASRFLINGTSAGVPVKGTITP